MNNIKAGLLRYSEVPWQSLMPLQTWLHGFDCNTNSLRVAQAANEQGEAICYVCYTKIDDAFVITAVAVASGATIEDCII
jgi:hypothetical protein